MSRRGDENFFEMLIQMPWWVGVIAAGVIYVISVVVGVRADTTNPAGAVTAVFIPKFGKFIASMCLLAAGISAVRQLFRRGLLKRQRGIESIRALRWEDFELLVGEAYRRQGYSVEETGQGGADGGVDLVLRKDGQTVLVQCKGWRNWQVGVNVVRELYGVMAAQHADHGIIVSSGTFTLDAEKFAAGKNVTLVDGRALGKLVKEVQGNTQAAATAEGTTPAGPPACPKCGAAMVLRTAKKGAHAGSEFYGCSRYPECKGIVNLR